MKLFKARVRYKYGEQMGKEEFVYVFAHTHSEATQYFYHGAVKGHYLVLNVRERDEPESKPESKYDPIERDFSGLQKWINYKPR